MYLASISACQNTNIHGPTNLPAQTKEPCSVLYLASISVCQNTSIYWLIFAFIATSICLLRPKHHAASTGTGRGGGNFGATSASQYSIIYPFLLRPKHHAQSTWQPLPPAGTALPTRIFSHQSRMQGLLEGYIAATSASHSSIIYLLNFAATTIGKYSSIYLLRPKPSAKSTWEVALCIHFCQPQHQHLLAQTRQRCLQNKVSRHGA